MFRKRLFVTEHLKDEQILRLLDRELPAADANHGQRHLDACWTCRARAARLQDCVEEFISWRNYRISREPLPSWNRFHVKLAAQVGAPHSNPSSTFPFFRPAFALAAALFLLGAVLVLRPVPVASANDLLQRAHSGELAVARTGERPVVHQRIRVQRGSAAATLEYWRGPHDQVLRETWSANSGVLPEDFKRFFKQHHLDARTPLSSVNHSRWRESLTVKEDVVTAERSRRRIRIQTTNPRAGTGDIHIATLTLRESDWHPLEQAYLIRTEEGGQEEYKLAELAFEVLPADQVFPGLFPDSPVPAPRLIELPTRVIPPPEPVLPSDDEFDTAEALVRQALHAVGADRREVPDVLRNGITITVRAVAETPQRAQELKDALSGIPYSVAEISHSTIETIATIEPAEAAHPTFTTTPPFSQALRKYAGGLDSANNLLNEIRDALRPLRVESLALQRLTQRYPGADRERLAPQAKQMVIQLFASHSAALRAGLDRLEPLLAPLLASLGAGEQDPSSTAYAPDQRQDRVRRLAGDLAALEETLGKMFDTNVLDQAVVYDGAALLRAAVTLHAEVKAIVRELQPASPAGQQISH
jgi:hypothetical protein